MLIKKLKIIFNRRIFVIENLLDQNSDDEVSTTQYVEIIENRNRKESDVIDLNEMPILKGLIREFDHLKNTSFKNNFDKTLTTKTNTDKKKVNHVQSKSAKSRQVSKPNINNHNQKIMKTSSFHNDVKSLKANKNIVNRNKIQ